MINPDGFLFLGASENIFGVTDKFESNHLGRTIIYKRKPE
jgi:chemotaxis methyl-accepting protein methylase